MKIIWKSFHSAAKKFARLFWYSMAVALLLSLVNIFVPWGLQQYLQQVTEQNSYRVIVIGVLFFAVYYIGKIFISMAWSVSLDKFGGKYMEDTCLSLEKAMAETSYGEIEKLKPGLLRNIIYMDVLNAFRTVGHHIPVLLGALAVIGATLLLSFFYDVKLTLFICLATGVGLFLSWCSRKILAKRAGQTNAKLKVHDQWCSQFVDMLPQIQQNPILDYYQKQTSRNLDDLVQTSIRENTRTVFWTGLVSGYNALFSITLSAILAIPVAGSSIPNLVFFTMIANLILEQAQTVESMFQLIVKAQVGFYNIDQVLALPKMGGETSTPEIHEVCFDRVSFSYNGYGNAVSDISCRLGRGDVILLKGMNGSGKSTFLKLLIGAYPVMKGEIFLNDRPISDYERKSLNKRILYINQEEKCLNETFRDYLELITEGRISDERYKELLRFVELPEDNRKISGNGASLSVGQRKKLFAMKLFLRFEEADVIILDELAAGLDVQTAWRVYERLFALAEEQNKILIFVDHAPPKNVIFTRVFQFQEGRLTEH